MASSSAIKILVNAIKRLEKEPVEGFLARIPDESNMFAWEIFIEGPRDTPYEGGVFQLEMNFPKDYPMMPPKLRFVSDFWHPNVYPDGRVCISILHPPGEDVASGESAAERWLPTQTVQTILLSVISMLNDPNCSSPANVDASVEWRDNRSSYVARCADLVKKAKAALPDDVHIPHPETNPAERRLPVDFEEDAFNLYDEYGAEDLDAFEDFGSDNGEFGSDDDIWGFSDDGDDDAAAMSDEEEIEAELKVKKKRLKTTESSVPAAASSSASSSSSASASTPASADGCGGAQKKSKKSKKSSSSSSSRSKGHSSSSKKSKKSSGRKSKSGSSSGSSSSSGKSKSRVKA